MYAICVLKVLPAQHEQIHMKLPKQLSNQIDTRIDLGLYSTRTQFIVEAIRAHLDKYTIDNNIRRRDATDQTRRETSTNYG
jgi:Arc/MetJ-type ribon-helix-helix transcriptional regulator